MNAVLTAAGNLRPLTRPHNRAENFHELGVLQFREFLLVGQAITLGTCLSMSPKFRNHHDTTEAMNEIKSVTSTAIPLLLDDIDTDRIIPARFLRCVTFDGLGEHAFEDDRKQDPNHPFDKPQFQGAGILVAGRNFGCGSSREHAPQSLMRWGIKAIIAESFAEIFFGNCGSLGIPAVKAARADLDKLAAAIEANPKLEVTVDLEALTVSAAGVTFSVSMPGSARDALVTGQWDYLGRLLSAADQIAEHAKKVPYMTGFSA